MRKIIIASDSFKGSLTSLEVARAAEEGVKIAEDTKAEEGVKMVEDAKEVENTEKTKKDSWGYETCDDRDSRECDDRDSRECDDRDNRECDIRCIEIADGGEGTGATLTRVLGGDVVKAIVSDPLGRKIEATYGIATISGQKAAIMEMAQASGLTLLKPSERNPLLTSTYGTGEMILDALNRGCRKFLIGIGGSATNDGGAGMLEALGFKFIDSNGREMTGMCGGNINRIARIVPPASHPESTLQNQGDMTEPGIVGMRIRNQGDMTEPGIIGVGIRNQGDMTEPGIIGVGIQNQGDMTEPGIVGMGIRNQGDMTEPGIVGMGIRNQGDMTESRKEIQEGTEEIWEKLSEAEFIIACDVDTPFCRPNWHKEAEGTEGAEEVRKRDGSEGAAEVFGPQKGATPEEVVLLEDGMQSLNNIIKRDYGIDLSSIKGTGAAGGLGGAFHAFLDGRLQSGIGMVLDAIGFEEQIKDADLIITGEGKIDSQTCRGKVISGITSVAAKHGVPVIAIAGIVDMSEKEIEDAGLLAAFQIGPRPQNESDLEYAMRPKVASKNISETVAKALASLFPSSFRGNL